MADSEYRAVQALTLFGALVMVAGDLALSGGSLIGGIGGSIAHLTGHSVAGGTAIGGAIGGSLWVGTFTAVGFMAGGVTAGAGFVTGVKTSGGAIALGSA